MLVAWMLETLAYYLKGCPIFDLWTNYRPLAQAMNKELRVMPEGKERVLRNLRGPASFAYYKIVFCISRDISKEVIKDPGLDKMWEAAEKDKDYQKVAGLIEGKADMEMMNMLRTAQSRSTSSNR